MASSSVQRIRRNAFTEADVKALLIDARERANAKEIFLGDTILEAANLVAHARRDRGLASDYIKYVFSQLSMLTRYQLDPKEKFPVDGKCDWWLKLYLTRQLTDAKQKDLREEFKTNKRQLLRETKSYFPEEKFPMALKRPVDSKFLQIVNFCSRSVRTKTPPSLSVDTLQRDIKNLLHLYSIDFDKTESFLLCLFILFHRANFELGFGVVADSHIEVRDNNGFLLPGAKLTITATVEVRKLPKPVRVGFPLISTERSYEDSFDEKMIARNDIGLPFLELDTDLEFDSRSARPIRKVETY